MCSGSGPPSSTTQAITPACWGRLLPGGDFLLSLESLGFYLNHEYAVTTGQGKDTLNGLCLTSVIWELCKEVLSLRLFFTGDFFKVIHNNVVRIWGWVYWLLSMALDPAYMISLPGGIISLENEQWRANSYLLCLAFSWSTWQRHHTLGMFVEGRQFGMHRIYLAQCFSNFNQNSLQKQENIMPLGIQKYDLKQATKVYPIRLCSRNIYVPFIVTASRCPFSSLNINADVCFLISKSLQK